MTNPYKLLLDIKWDDLDKAREDPENMILRAFIGPPEPTGSPTNRVVVLPYGDNKNSHKGLGNDSDAFDPEVKDMLNVLLSGVLQKLNSM